MPTLVAEMPPLRQNADGVFLVGGTRVTLDTIIGAWRDGATAEEIALQYSAVSLDAIYGAVAYYLRHRETVEAYLAERAQHSLAVQSETESRIPERRSLRARLLARQVGHI